MNKKFLCIHGHFYQPPRENPWSGVIEEQAGAAPFHDWNERITSECYCPNRATRILNNYTHPIQTVSNYANMSFNVGPTLLSWMEGSAPDVYASILESDKQSTKRFSGHGAAIAQAYNHMILPLSNDRDKQTQVIWGIKDFQYRFKRKPEGMWLPETAVNLSTLEALAKQGIVFTILAPTQAQAIKQEGGDSWVDVRDGSIDTQRPYVCRLPSGKKIVLFFYNGNIANEVAFGTLLKNGVTLADRLMREYPQQTDDPRLVHIANDGETYGHHHAFGNMALAYMLYYVEINQLAKVTIYGEFLEQHPPEYEVKIIEDTSWSCFHGVDRWRAHCGCRLDLEVEWNQQWRQHLRNALDWLRNNLGSFYEQAMLVYFDDPWRIRDDYIDVMLHRSEESVLKTLWGSARQDISDNDKKKIIGLLEMQRYTMLMYTSCGWFFDDISGLETIQILQYAARAIQLAREAGGHDLEDEFVHGLEQAKSNIPEMENGKTIYNRFVKPVIVAS